MSNFARSSAEWRLDTPPVEGPSRTFGASFSQAFDEQVKTWSVFAVEHALEQEHGNLRHQVYELTGKRLDPVLLDNPTALATARHFEDGADLPDVVAKQVAELEELRKEYPDIPTIEDVWRNVQKAAQATDRRASTFQNRGRNFGSRAGGFLGSVIGAINPDTDPINFFSLGLAGFGTKLGVRIASEVGIGAVAEGINQFTGVQENRRLLGLDYGFDQAVQQIALTGVGAGVIRGGAEGAAFGFRRVAGRLTPTERASMMHRESVEQIRQQSIYGDTPTAQRIFADDFEAHYQRYEQWLPETSRDLVSTTAIADVPTGVQVVRASPQLLQGVGRSLDEFEDPQIARQMDRATQAADRADEAIAKLEAERVRLMDESTGLNQRVADMQSQINAPGTSAKSKTRLNTSRARVQSQKASVDRKVEKLEAKIARQASKRDTARRHVDALSGRESPQGLSARQQTPSARPFVEGMVGRRLEQTSPDQFVDPQSVDEILGRVEAGAEARASAMAQQLGEDGMVDVGGTRVPKDIVISTEDGEITIEAMFRDFSEDDELLQAAHACKVIA